MRSVEVDGLSLRDPRALHGLPYLTDISCTGEEFSDGWLAELGQQDLPLRHLALRWGAFGGTGLGLGIFRTLKRLEVSWCDAFLEAGLVEVCSLPLLERLELHDCQCLHLSSEGIIALRKASRLQHILLDGCDQIGRNPATQLVSDRFSKTFWNRLA